VYDFGANYEGRMAPQSLGLGWANFGPVDEFRIQRWNGSAWGNVLTVAGFERPFGADAAVSFSRASSNSLHFTPNGTNSTPQWTHMADWVDRWCRIGDGTNTILAQIKRVYPGQFSNASGVLEMSFEIDYDSIVTEAGAFASLSTATTGGTFNLFGDDGMGIAGGEGQDTIRYYAFEWDLPAGQQIPKGGYLAAGPVYYLARAARDGSTIEYISRSDVSQVPGSNFLQGTVTRRRDQRVISLPYDLILVRAGMYSGAGTEVDTLGIVNDGDKGEKLIGDSLHGLPGGANAILCHIVRQHRDRVAVICHRMPYRNGFPPCRVEAVAVKQLIGGDALNIGLALRIHVS